MCHMFDLTKTVKIFGATNQCNKSYYPKKLARNLQQAPKHMSWFCHCHVILSFEVNDWLFIGLEWTLLSSPWTSLHAEDKRMRNIRRSQGTRLLNLKKRPYQKDHFQYVHMWYTAIRPPNVLLTVRKHLVTLLYNFFVGTSDGWQIQQC